MNKKKIIISIILIIIAGIYLKILLLDEYKYPSPIGKSVYIERTEKNYEEIGSIIFREYLRTLISRNLPLNIRIGDYNIDKIDIKRKDALSFTYEVTYSVVPIKNIKEEEWVKQTATVDVAINGNNYEITRINPPEINLPD